MNAIYVVVLGFAVGCLAGTTDRNRMWAAAFVIVGVSIAIAVAVP